MCGLPPGSAKAVQQSAGLEERLGLARVSPAQLMCTELQGHSARGRHLQDILERGERVPEVSGTLPHTHLCSLYGHSTFNLLNLFIVFRCYSKKVVHFQAVSGSTQNIAFSAKFSNANNYKMYSSYRHTYPMLETLVCRKTLFGNRTSSNVLSANTHNTQFGRTTGCVEVKKHKLHLSYNNAFVYVYVCVCVVAAAQLYK